MPVAMKLHASLVVQLLPVPCHSRLSPTALLSDSCNFIAGEIATRATSRVAVSRAPASEEANKGAGSNASPARTALTTGARSPSGIGSLRACKRHATSGGVAMPRSATGRLPLATTPAAATLAASATPTATTTRQRTPLMRRQAVPTATTDGAQLLQRYLQLGLTLLPCLLYTSDAADE